MQILRFSNKSANAIELERLQLQRRRLGAFCYGIISSRSLLTASVVLGDIIGAVDFQIELYYLTKFHLNWTFFCSSPSISVSYDLYRGAPLCQLCMWPKMIDFRIRQLKIYHFGCMNIFEKSSSFAAIFKKHEFLQIVDDLSTVLNGSELLNGLKSCMRSF